MDHVRTAQHHGQRQVPRLLNHAADATSTPRGHAFEPGEPTTAYGMFEHEENDCVRPAVTP